MSVNGLLINKLPTDFGEDITKCILFSKEKNLLKLNITYNRKRKENKKEKTCYSK